MLIGLVPNTQKDNIVEIVVSLVAKLSVNGFDVVVADAIESQIRGEQSAQLLPRKPLAELCRESDIVLSIGGDGTMLTTAFETRKYQTPVLGINIGKLGFLAEFDMSNIDKLINNLKAGKYSVGERTTLQATSSADDEEMFAINDFVIDKGRWPKMIEITLKVDNDYVSSFSADGIIIATPTGSTGYSLSTGGPIVSPTAKAINISPISPHTLNMRPLVLSDDQKIQLTVNSLGGEVQLSADGQRVKSFKTPVKINVDKSPDSIKLIQTVSTNYFQILRKKLFWGLDVRKEANNNGEGINV